MRQSAAKQGDQVLAIDTHTIVTPTGRVDVQYPFAGVIQDGLSGNVNIHGKPAATIGSVARIAPHIPIGGSFVRPPSNSGTITTGSGTVHINGKPAARNGDTARTCNDPVDLEVGTVIAVGTVRMG